MPDQASNNMEDWTVNTERRKICKVKTEKRKRPVYRLGRSYRTKNEGPAPDTTKAHVEPKGHSRKVGAKWMDTSPC